MRDYQDTVTGAIHSFDDQVDPFELCKTNRNIPKTLTRDIIPRPEGPYVWYQGNWALEADVPEGYRAPKFSIPSYDPAWAVFLGAPYTLVVPSEMQLPHFSISSLIEKGMSKEDLAKVVCVLPTLPGFEFNAIVTHDGAIAIQRNNFATQSPKIIDYFNRVLCAILIGGQHTVLVDRKDLVGGQLAENTDNLHVFNPVPNVLLRHYQLDLLVQMQWLQNCRFISVKDLLGAYQLGAHVISAIPTFSPHFLLHGYTSMIFGNFSEALGSFWISVEQITSYMWEKFCVSKDGFHPQQLRKSRQKSMTEDNRTWSTSIKQEMLWQKSIFSETAFVYLNGARKARNDLVHSGKHPARETVINLWQALIELLELSSQREVGTLPLRECITFVSTPMMSMNFNLLKQKIEMDLEKPDATDFSQWDAMVAKFLKKQAAG
ncbi:hypothetical protein I5R65_07795 [Herbaspirillum sp. AP02]|uniref:hypothetical protein n=1 Tax=unclassified Herbaspirillum TaxID=2624150 RepID=UPI0015DB09A9|nr:MULTISPECIES: hypothetical protein [unclassified Herbaspirillum]MBG7619363.1 hypothetical protein [Herbaspirillum sp. AP02]NZD66647.1 hypothetical protein [Herbaspirillum sp. AP21]